MTQSKTLKELLEQVSSTTVLGADPAVVLVDSLATDSRKVGRGTLFLALPGEKQDGHAFLDEAVRAGCVALVVEENKVDAAAFADRGVTVVTVMNSRAALGTMAAAFFDYPVRQLRFVGITGTNGKTTITYLLEKVLKDQGEQVGVIGTVNYRFGDRSGASHECSAPFTTPDPLILQSLLRRMADAGVGTVLMEVSSHALVQQRLGDIKFDLAVFTNLSHDHLDYHATMEEYFQAKTLLFVNHLRQSGTAVISFQDSDDAPSNTWSSALMVLLQKRGIDFVSTGRQPGSIVMPLQIGVELDRTTLTLLLADTRYSLVSPLVGRFNAENIMTTLAVAQVMGCDINEAIRSLSTASGAPGRLEKISQEGVEAQKAVAFVDYAHTPDALQNVLSTLQGLPHERLICVFGCGGDRDRAKRPEMGKIAAQYADIAIVTDDNPRSEDNKVILAAIVEGIRSAGMVERASDWLFTAQQQSGCVVIADRRQAIISAIQCAGENDVVVVAGKGHEKYQQTSAGRRFFDDSLEVREAQLSWDVAAFRAALGADSTDFKGNRSFSGISTDSRKISKRQVFVALQGESFDGHDYVETALAQGAGALVAAKSVKIKEGLNIPVFKVADTLEALGALAAYRRRKLASLSAPCVVAITGSTGKTTVKEMSAAIFSQQWPDISTEPDGRVLKTQGNFNNLIGLPLSLLPLQLRHKVAVLEMGMNTPGEISRLTGIADPDISCIVNVHGAHLEGLGSIEGVAKEKEQLFRGTNRRGILIVNLDDPHISTAAAQYEQRKISWSAEQPCRSGADIFASNIRCRRDGCMSFKLHMAEAVYDVSLGVPGRHNVNNSLAAAAIACGAGVSGEVIVKGLESFAAPAKRLVVVKAAAGYSILDDTYNANPASMAAGLAALADMEGNNKIAILGDMLELGGASGEAHREVGRIAAASGLSYLLVLGTFAEYVANGAIEAGMGSTHIRIFSAKNEIVQWMKNHEKEGGVSAGSWVLVKASRGIGLEMVVESLIAGRQE
jgi:MurE/MurF fusion protein